MGKRQGQTVEFARIEGSEAIELFLPWLGLSNENHKRLVDAEQGCEVCIDYAMNVIINVVNRDITVFVQLLARFRNM
eukprot:m51a1_g7150 hypothetical protein (77) ;mRNA; r:331965-334368